MVLLVEHHCRHVYATLENLNLILSVLKVLNSFEQESLKVRFAFSLDHW